ncbi:MAG TPA: hypothetical protein VMF61_11940 [Candidatus Acidoferrales bacterium]|nr:hypothetical protein [Candidatus Acidoferrales bacterium]
MTGNELAAVAVALGIAALDAGDRPVAEASAWSMAMRRPDLEFDELRALRKASACSPRF